MTVLGSEGFEVEQLLPGGNVGGAVLVDGTVRRATGPWTPAVHALLRHLADRGFDGAPRVLGIDAAGREMVSFLPGATTGTARPWPSWTHSDTALVQAGAWLRRYHRAVSDFVPPPGAVWRGSSRSWQPGDVVGHNDAAPYNAVWDVEHDRLVGFFDWDFAGPCPAVRDLAFVAFSWTPLHARDAAAEGGFTRFAERPHRLRMLLDAYGYGGSTVELLDAVRVRITDHVAELRRLAAAGDPPFARLVRDGAAAALERAVDELDRDRADLASG